MSRIIDKYKFDGNEYAIVDDGNGAPLRLVALGTVREEPTPLIPEPTPLVMGGQGRDDSDDAEGGGVALTVCVLAGLFIVLIVALAFFV
jgi:hypothetical protein